MFRMLTSSANACGTTLGRPFEQRSWCLCEWTAEKSACELPGWCRCCEIGLAPIDGRGLWVALCGHRLAGSGKEQRR